MVDAVIIVDNPYDRSYADTIQAQTVSFGVKNNIVAKWYPTAGATYDFPKGETAGIWKLASNSTTWLSPTFTTYNNISNAIGVAKNGLLYSVSSSSQMYFSQASNYCNALGMTLPSLDTSLPSQPHGWTWTKTSFSGSQPAHTSWFNGTVSSSDSYDTSYLYVRCVR